MVDTNDPEIDDPEIDDPEIDDPEIDDDDYEDEDDEYEDDNDEYEDDDENEKKPEPNWNDWSSWVNFLKALIFYFIVTIFLGVLGSNFIYLTTRGSDLDIIFPTYDKFYSAKKIGVSKPSPANIDGCNEVSSGTGNIIFDDNFPYNLIDETTDVKQIKAWPLGKRFGSWFGKISRGVFKNNRAYFKGYLDNFPPNTLMGNHTFIIYIVAPFTLLMSFFGAGLSGFCTAIGTAFSADTKLTVYGGFLLFSWAVIFLMSAILVLRFVATLVFLPMSQNWKEVSNIMACNVTALVVLFGFFACGCAYDTLDADIASIMGIIYLALVAVTLFKKKSKDIF
jgi:hypothetical protein